MEHLKTTEPPTEVDSSFTSTGNIWLLTTVWRGKETGYYRVGLKIVYSFGEQILEPIRVLVKVHILEGFRVLKN